MCSMAYVHKFRKLTQMRIFLLCFQYVPNEGKIDVFGRNIEAEERLHGTCGQNRNV